MEPQDSSGKPVSKAAPLQLLLTVPGLPAVSQKLAQKIRDLEFIEMIKFLPSNKTVSMLKNSAMFQQAVLGVLKQLQCQESGKYNDMASVLFIICGNNEQAKS